MSTKYKIGDKVWVKGRVVPSTGVGDDEVVVRIRTSFGESTIGVVPNEDVTPDASPWRPIEEAPKDGTWILGTSYDCKASPHGGAAFLVHWIDSPLCGKGWTDECADEFGMCFYELTHYMLVPELPARPEEKSNEQ